MFRHRSKVGGARQDGVYTCSRCGQVLFQAKYKFEVGSGFPSFWQQEGESIAHCPLDTYGRQRVQLLCSQCHQHLGHLFEDSRTPSGVRYCINAGSIISEPDQLS